LLKLNYTNFYPHASNISSSQKSAGYTNFYPPASNISSSQKSGEEQQ